MKSSDDEQAQAIENPEDPPLIYIIEKREEDDRRKKDLPTAIRVSFDHIDDFEDMYSMIFLYVIEYYRSIESFDGLLNSRKNLRSMLQSLHDNLSK